MRLKIVQAGDPVLREQARPLAPEEILLPETQELIEWMRETMYDAPGVGLAAPQVGLPLEGYVDPGRAGEVVQAPCGRWALARAGLQSRQWQRRV